MVVMRLFKNKKKQNQLQDNKISSDPVTGNVKDNSDATIIESEDQTIASDATMIDDDESEGTDATMLLPPELAEEFMEEDKNR